MATSTKVKKKVFTGITHEEATTAARKFAMNSHFIAREEANMNTEISEVKKKYEKTLLKLKSNLKEPGEILEAYANETKATWGKKSRDLMHCMIGFRTGTPKVAKTSRLSWEAILELLRKSGLTSFIRTKEEINKEAILAEKDEVMISQLKENYLIVDQDESFFIEAKTEEVTA